ncbi:hypothetical protein PHYBOEH_002667 [Phytophthora boehmeriae]|uniref:Uncharacterized protein n=1 Tax=Phytophthora boehmeriae TaxID=109152 RepID=A0A8T1WX80_9STRA|nr:hypothetical protein PHYBOEH_002667 [Phytophthora boehmeriae]
MFIPGNEIVNVRFTFSRGNNRSHNGSTNISQQSEEVEALEIGTSERDVMSLSGAFSPGAELESALNSAAVDDAEGPDDITVPEVGGSTDTNNVTTTTQNDDELSVPVDSEQSPHDDGHPSDYPENKIPMVEQVEPTYSSVDTKDIISIPAEQSNREKNSEDEDEAYDGDDFDPCPSARYNDDTTPENEDKIEASGYGSEFEDDTFNVDLKAFSPRVGGNNQENDEEGEVSYSHDGFVD